MTTEEQKQALRALLEQRKPAITFIETVKRGPVAVAFDNVISINAWFVHETTNESDADIEQCIQQIADGVRRAMTEIREGLAKQAEERAAMYAEVVADIKSEH